MVDPDRQRPAVAVAVSLLSPLWRVPGLKPVLVTRRAANAALARACFSSPTRAELVVALADDALIRDLNRRYRGRNRPTNVLAFAAGLPGRPPPAGQSVPLGEVVVAFETVAREAANQGKALAHHLSHLVVHGVLHLMGYDHELKTAAQAMERLEVKVLAELGISDPYTIVPGAARLRVGQR